MIKTEDILDRVFVLFNDPFCIYQFQIGQAKINIDFADGVMHNSPAKHL